MLIVGVGLLVINLRNNHEFPGLCPKIENPNLLPCFYYGYICKAARGSG